MVKVVAVAMVVTMCWPLWQRWFCGIGVGGGNGGHNVMAVVAKAWQWQSQCDGRGGGLIA